jgi:hypothetical protein
MSVEHVVSMADWFEHVSMWDVGISQVQVGKCCGVCGAGCGCMRETFICQVEVYDMMGCIGLFGDVVYALPCWP